LDEAESLEESDYLLMEYELAFGVRDWSIYRKKVA
jgi:hypothetical protein